MKCLPFLRRAMLSSVIALSMVGAAQAVSVTREFSASWFDPSRSGHGFSLEVISDAGGKSLAAYWFTYDQQGRQMWVIGKAPITGNTVTMTGYTTSGGSFTNQFDPGAVRVTPWGTLTFTFSGCESANVRYQPNETSLPGGTITLNRLTSLFNASCTGGLIDDRAVAAASAGTEIVQFMANTGLTPAASGKARFQEAANRTDFSVEAEDLAVGDYIVRVDGTSRGTLNVHTVPGGTEGELEFRSPVEPGKVLLDFDPRGKLVEIAQGTSVYLTTTLGTGAGVTPPPGGNPPPAGNGLYELVVEPQGNDGAELHAKLVQRTERSDFSVELEDVPTGSYTLRVGGADQATFDVITVPGGTTGEVEFRNPVEAGKEPLDFDPRGQLVEALRGGQVVISGLFPNAPTGPVNGGGSGGGNDDNGDDNGDDHGGGSGGGDDDNGSGGGGDDHGGGTGGGGDDNGGGSGGGGDDDNGGGSGGGGDDDNGNPGGTPPVSIAITLTSTGADRDANGTATYEQTGDEKEFEVEIQDVDDGSYDLKIGGTSRGTLVTSRGRAKLRFAAPTRSDRLPLDFDPRGQRIEVSRDGTLYLQGTLQ